MARSLLLVVVVALAARLPVVRAGADEQEATTPASSAETSTVEDIEPMVAEAVAQAFKLGLPVFTQFGSDPNISSECSAALVKTMLALRRMEPWAIRSEWGESLPSSVHSGLCSVLGVRHALVTSRGVSWMWLRGDRSVKREI